MRFPIILTGAMTPLGFESSDGLQNLTESFLAARVVAPGIYVVMHNHVFPVDRVRKGSGTGAVCCGGLKIHHLPPIGGENPTVQ